MTKNEALAAATATEKMRGLRNTLDSARNVYTAARDYFNKVEADFNETHLAIFDEALARLESNDDT
jgi:hypothetical protein